MSGMIDALGRPFTDLRISVTDRCNFRCTYCMPKEAFGPGHRFLPQASLLSFEEITSLVKVFLHLGLRKIRITGGEPLMRKDLPRLIGMLRSEADARGTSLDLALTSNGSMLRQHAIALKQAGLDRVTVSLDALDESVFRAMSGTLTPVRQVLDGIDAAEAAGLGPVKVNMVVKRGHNESQVLPMAHRFASRGVELRFIEYMDVGSRNAWASNEVVPVTEILSLLQRHFDLRPARHEPGETAMRYRCERTGAHFGFIASISQPFCGTCSRLRLSSDGTLHTCLFSGKGVDLRSLMRGGAGEAMVIAAVTRIWRRRADRYSELRASAVQGHTGEEPRPEMNYIGG